MEEQPVVSVHMITYNHAPYIGQAIEGVLQQKTDFPFELVIMPLAHFHDFSKMDDALSAPLAEIITEVAARLAALFGELPFNLTIHTAPNTIQSPKRAGYWSTISIDWHWQIEIIPRLSPVHGFEWSTGLFINPTPPEEAARLLRAAKI